MSKITIKTIAKEANVSTATVSKALDPDGKYKISKQVRDTVLDVARKYNYTPNPSARNLRQGNKDRYIIVLNLATRDELANLLLLTRSIKLLEDNKKSYQVLYLSESDNYYELFEKSKASYSICINITNTIVLNELTKLDIKNYNLSSVIGIENSCFINTNKVSEIDFLISKYIFKE